MLKFFQRAASDLRDPPYFFLRLLQISAAFFAKSPLSLKKMEQVHHNIQGITNVMSKGGREPVVAPRIRAGGR
jgi:hypothetical protein